MPTLSKSNPDAGLRESASFRDPAGFLFQLDGQLLRQVNPCGRADYERLLESGLYDRLSGQGLLIPHEERPLSYAFDEQAVKVLEPERVRVISYPYEWCFSQLRDAALATLEIQSLALESGMSLKDASAYNIQFHEGRPTLIDTLSFEVYREGRPWAAYRQFCQHFLAPLALMTQVDVRLSALLRSYIDGIPLDLAARMLPASSRLKWSLLSHIHLHAGAQAHSAKQQKADKAEQARREPSLSRHNLEALLDSLRSAVEGMEWKPRMGVWGDYYDGTNYSDDSFRHKREIVRDYLQSAEPRMVWDLGANNGLFSRLAASAGAKVVSMDVEPAAVEANYRRCKNESESNILPLWMDLTNPSPGLGWAGAERQGLASRGRADVVMALALVHHLAIGNNTPLPEIARYFRRLGKSLIIELVPKEDSQVKRMLATREDVFPSYDQAGFEAAFEREFEIGPSQLVRGSCRRIYFMTARTSEG